ncbi:MAG: hypothetical protein FJ164_04545 [Gammaproteobacteria bacterium]|nr:hypothetical protein [Gammaproteobacteria bacterium]
MDTSLDDKLEFLSQACAYGHGVVDVEVIETHLSWVFLAGESVYKLKKPVFRLPVDFSTLAVRKVHCEAEVRLNQRLAPGVYLGIVPLVRVPDGALRLGTPDEGQMEVVEWLVHMRRLHRASMLDTAIASGAVPLGAPEAIGQRLAEFYGSAREVAPEGREYRERLAGDLDDSVSVLMDPTFALRDTRIRGVLGALRRFMDREAVLLEQRVRDHRIVEGHGDLKPEHVYLSEPPLIIDCLEFSTVLRELDPLDELAYLGLECSRLGAAWVGEQVLQSYRSHAQDDAPDRLVSFHRAARGRLRAKLCLWHLLDCPVSGFDHWRKRARQYLDLAEAAAQACGPA